MRIKSDIYVKSTDWSIVRETERERKRERQTDYGVVILVYWFWVLAQLNHQAP